MMLFFLPAIDLPSTEVINQNQIHIDEVALVVDEVVVDALADATNINVGDNTCNFGVNDKFAYDNKINDYVALFEEQRKKYTDINCSYDLSNTDLDGENYTATIDILCTVEKNNLSNNIKKQLMVDKTIQIDEDVANEKCILIIVENYNNMSVFQFEKEVPGYSVLEPEDP